MSPRARHVERISCSEARLSPDQQQRCSGWVYVYWFDHGKPVTRALHSSRGSCQSFGSIFVCLVPGGGVVTSSLECLLRVTYVDLPISHSLAPVTMATRAVNADTTGERLRNIHGNGHTRVNPVCVCLCVCLQSSPIEMVHDGVNPPCVCVWWGDGEEVGVGGVSG